MMRKNWVKLLVKYFLVAFVAVSFCFLVVFPVYQMFVLPKPYTIALPEFRGRILPAEKIKSGTFTLKESFDSISEWGEEALLVYGDNYADRFGMAGGKVVLKAWRPDSKTSGTFQYAEKVFERPSDWGFCHVVGDIKRDGNCLVVSATTSWPIVFPILGGFLLCFILLCLLQLPWFQS